jgi:uncharacterized protein YaeQ
LRTSLLFEAVFEQLQVELTAVERVPKVVGKTAIVAAIDARQQQSQKCKTGCEGHHNCSLLAKSHNATRIWRQR